MSRGDGDQNGKSHFLYRSSVEAPDVEGGAPVYPLYFYDKADRSWVRGQKTRTVKESSAGYTKEEKTYSYEYLTEPDFAALKYPVIDYASYSYDMKVYDGCEDEPYDPDDRNSPTLPCPTYQLYFFNDTWLDSGFRFMDHVLTETHEGSSSIDRSQTFNYVDNRDDAAFAQLRSVTDSVGDGNGGVAVRTTEYQYAHEQASSGGMSRDGTHILTEPYSVSITSPDGILRRTWTEFQFEDSDGDGIQHWRSTKRWEWTGSSPDDTSAPVHPGGSETELVSEVVLYDSHGRPVEEKNALGTSTFREYGGALAPWGGTEASDGAYLTRVYSNLDGQDSPSLSVEFGYNDRGLISEIVDENGNEQTFEYDGLQRLIRTRNADGDRVSEFSYDYGGNTNAVITARYGGAGGESAVITDGLGRPVQSLERAGYDATYSSVTDIVLATKYDRLGRPKQDYRAFPINRLAGALDHVGNVETKANAYYDGSPGPDAAGRPYTETVYDENPLNRISSTRKSGDIGNQAETRTSYGVSNSGLSGIGGSQVVTTTDEVSDMVSIVFDGFGNKASVSRGLASPDFTQTSFDYGPAGLELQEIIHPDTSRTTLSRDRRARIVEKVHPDTDTTRYKYDSAGNIRFSEDAKQRKAGSLQFTTYDGYGRILRKGITSASYESLSPHDSYPFESDTSTFRHVRVYDKYPEQDAYPWNQLSSPHPQHSQNRNLKNRVAAEAYRSVDRWQLTYYAYDKEGRIRTYHVRTQGMRSMDYGVCYSYDRQGNVVKKEVNVAGDTAYLWYTYNYRGLLSEIYFSDTNSRLSDADLSYEYNPSGQVSTTSYKNASSLSREYTSQGWIHRIGELTNTSAPFAAENTYRADGQIVRSVFYQPGITSAHSRFLYQYTYDSLKRLISADYSDMGLHTDPRAYDVDSLSYDALGNIQGLRRFDETGSVMDDLSYTYQGANRLVSVDDKVSDIGGVGEFYDQLYFQYDALGNMTDIVAHPYALYDIEYDERSLPTDADWGGGANISYRYSAAGERYSKKVFIISLMNLISSASRVKCSAGFPRVR